MKKILITGGGSKFVRPLINELNLKSKQIYLLTKKSTISNLNVENISYLKFDLKKSFNIPIDVDVIFHLAAVVPYNKKKASENIIRENLLITNNILNFAAKNKIKKIIFISTTDIYPLVYQKKISINTPINCNSEYGLSKLMCERLITSFSGIFNIPYVILRLGPIYSETDPKVNMISRILFDLKLNKSVHINNPKNINCYLDIESAAKAMALSLKKKNKIYIISGRSIELKKFILLAKNRYKSKSKVYFNNSTKLKIRLNFDLKRTYRDLLWKPKNIKDLFLN